MINASSIYLFMQIAIWLAVVAVVIAVVVPLLRWTFRINEQVALQREILANLRRINANTDQSSSSDNP